MPLKETTIVGTLRTSRIARSAKRTNSDATSQTNAFQKGSGATGRGTVMMARYARGSSFKATPMNFRDIHYYRTRRTAATAPMTATVVRGTSAAFPPGPSATSMRTAMGVMTRSGVSSSQSSPAAMGTRSRRTGSATRWRTVREGRTRPTAGGSATRPADLIRPTPSIRRSSHVARNLGLGTGTAMSGTWPTATEFVFLKGELKEMIKALSFNLTAFPSCNDFITRCLSLMLVFEYDMKRHGRKLRQHVIKRLFKKFITMMGN